METLRRGHLAELERRRVEEEQQEARRRKLHEDSQLMSEVNEAEAVVDDVNQSTKKRKRPSVREEYLMLLSLFSRFLSICNRLITSLWTQNSAKVLNMSIQNSLVLMFN